MRCDWNLAKTRFENVLEYFCRFEIGFRNFFCPKRREERNVDLEKFCPSKEGEYSKASQKRSKESRSLKWESE